MIRVAYTERWPYQLLQSFASAFCAAKAGWPVCSVGDSSTAVV